MSIENVEETSAVDGLSNDATPALVQVTRGQPRAEEIAALVAVITAAASNGGGSNDTSNGPLELWGDKAQALNPRAHFSFSPRSYANGSLGSF